MPLPPSSANDYPKRYYTRTFFRTFSFVVGIGALLVGVIVLFAGTVAAAIQVLVVGSILTLFGRANQKPRIVLNRDSVLCVPNPVHEGRTIPLSALARVDEHLEFYLKDGASLKMPWREFSKKTRTSVVQDIHALLSSLS